MCRWCCRCCCRYGVKIACCQWVEPLSPPLPPSLSLSPSLAFSVESVESFYWLGIFLGNGNTRHWNRNRVIREQREEIGVKRLECKSLRSPKVTNSVKSRTRSPFYFIFLRVCVCVCSLSLLSLHATLVFWYNLRVS